MKFYLHWLQYDLRRFRRPLTIWVMMVTAYAVLLGWLHLNILTVDPSVIRWTRWMEVFLFPQAFVLLGQIFSSDPAGGPQPFWKTRPPGGLSIAGGKLTLAVVFFLVLPMLAWLVMKAFCVRPGYAEASSGGLSLTGSLGWALTLIISACALGTAGSRDEMNGVLRTGWMVITLFVLLLAVEAAGWISGGSEPRFQPASELLRGCRTLMLPALAFPLCTGVFLAARRTRVPSRWTVPAVLLLPPGLIGLTFLLFRAPVTPSPDESLPPLEPAIAGKIKIRETSPGTPVLQRTGSGGGDSGNQEPMAIYRLFLPVEGLPADSIAYGRWLDLKLTAPDGRELAIDQEISLSRTNRLWAFDRAEGWIFGCGAVFRERALRPFSLLPCRVEGHLRLTVHTRRETALNLNERNTVENALGRFRFRRPSRGEDPITPKTLNFVPPLAALLRQPEPDIEFSINFLPFGLGNQRLRWPSSDETRGSRMEYKATLFDFLSDSQDLLNVSKKWQESNGIPVSEVQLVMNWYEPLGTVDFPVVFQQVVVPALPGDDRKPSALLAALNPPENPRPEEARLRLEYAIGLIVQPDANDAEGPARLSAWEQLLAKMTRTHFPDLLDLCEKSAAAPVRDPERWEPGLRKRVAELLRPADLPGIRARPALAGYLENLLGKMESPGPGSAAPAPDGKPAF